MINPGSGPSSSSSGIPSNINTPITFNIGERHVMATKAGDDQRISMNLSRHGRNSSQDSFDSCSSNGSLRMKQQQQRRMDKTLRLKSMSAAPPTSSSSRFPRQNASFGNLTRAPRKPGQQQSPSSPSSNSNFLLPRGHASAHVFSSMSHHNSSTSNSTFKATGNASFSVSSNNGAYRANALMQIAQRSNGSTVKSVIADLQRLSQASTTAAPDAVGPEVGEHATTTATATPAGDDDKEQKVPTEQMEMLAHWASADSYYRVLISKYQGIPAILNAMKAFGQEAEFQTNALIVLQHLEKNKSPQEASDIMAAIARALELHKDDLTVQSEGWMALKPMAPLLVQPQNKATLLLVMKLLPAAQKNDLTPTGKASITILAEFLVKYIARQQLKQLQLEQKNAAAQQQPTNN